MTSAKHTVKGVEDYFEPLCEVISTHKGRKTAITRSLSNGIPLNMVMQLSGHKQLKTMIRKMQTLDQINKRSRPPKWVRWLRYVAKCAWRILIN